MIKVLRTYVQVWQWMTFLKFFEDVLKVDEIGSDQEK